MNKNELIIRHLKTFLYLSKQQPFDVVCKSAIYLLQNLPSTRHAVLEYFNTIFELATVLYINKTSQDDLNNLNDVIDEIHQVFLNLVKNEPWSTELFDWAIDLIGNSCKNYENLLFKLPPSQQQQQQQQQQTQQISIQDSLHGWTQCKSIKNLLEIAQICMTECKNKSEIIDKLLNLNNKFGSKTDWIICHLGSLSSNETILNLIIIGFKEFVLNQQNKTSINIIKFNSIINILNYFTNVYSTFIRSVFVQIFQSYLKGDYDYFKRYFLLNSDQIKQYTILYLTHLALLSSNLYYIISYNIKETLNYNILENICSQFKQILNYEIRNSLFINLKHLLKQLTNTPFDYLMYLIDLAIDINIDEEMRMNIKYFIQSFLDDLNSFILTNAKESIQIIEYLRKDYKLVLNELLINSINNDLKKKWLLNIVVLIGVQGPSYITNSIMSKLLVTKHYDINNLIKYRQEIDVFDINSINYSIDTILKILKSNKNYLKNEQIYVNDQTGIDITINENFLDNFLNNLIELHEWDQKNEHLGYSIDKIMSKPDSFIILIELLENNISTIINFYNKIPLPDNLNIDQCLLFSFHIVKYFFKIIELENDQTKQISELENIKKIIQFSCAKYNEILRNILLRTIIDHFFDQTNFYNFQSKRPKLYDNNNNENYDIDEEDPDSDKYVSLYEQNLALNKTLPLTKLSTKIPLVHNFSRNDSKLADKQEQLIILNYELMEIIEIICSYISTQIKTTKSNYNSDLLNNLACLAVEKLNPTFIDYQWPEIENFKFYIERDVKIQNIIDESPVCWMILNFIGNNQSAFCKCVPMIRSLLSSLILQWENVKEQSTQNSPKLLELTFKYLNLINKAQLLPSPLLYIVDIISLINSYETHIVLTIIWKYLKIILQQQTNTNKTIIIQHKTLDKQMIDQLKFIFQRNISKLAHFYSKFFKDLTTTNTSNSTNSNSNEITIS